MAIDPTHDPRQMDLFPETLDMGEEPGCCDAVNDRPVQANSLYAGAEWYGSLKGIPIDCLQLDGYITLEPSPIIEETPFIETTEPYVYPRRVKSPPLFKLSKIGITKHCLVYCGDSCDCGRRDFYMDIGPSTE